MLHRSVFNTLLSFVFLFTIVSTAWSQSVEELAMYKGPDREKMLLEGAKKEGKVVWYTSLSGRSYRTIRDEFAKKYPDVQIDVYRAGSKDLSQKILAEAKSGNYLADAIESTPPILMLLRSRNILTPYTSPQLSRYPEDSQIKAKDGGVYWVTDRESFIGLGYNTNLVPKDKVPRNFEDLLNPFFKDKLMMAISSTGDRVIGTMLKTKGAEYVEKFKEQHVSLHKISGTATRDLIISGEFYASPTVFRNHALVKINEGAQSSKVAPPGREGSTLKFVLLRRQT